MAVVIGTAFAALVAAFVSGLVTPLIAAVGGDADFSRLSFTINGSSFRYGVFINALISFLIIAAVIFFFVIKPVNALMSRRNQEAPPEEQKRDCPECRSEIPVLANRCAFCTAEVGPEPAAAAG